jgi:hypothetical protein
MTVIMAVPEQGRLSPKAPGDHHGQGGPRGLTRSADLAPVHGPRSQGH